MFKLVGAMPPQIFCRGAVASIRPRQVTPM